MSRGKLLVAGGAGYVGSHTVRYLLATGYAPSDLVIFDNLERGHGRFVPEGVELERGDMRERGSLDAVFRRHRFEAVLHFAAYAYVGESMEKPALYFENNVAGALNLLEAARVNGCRRFVFSSSCTVYGTPARLPITEEMPTAPENPYGNSKLMFENIVAWYARIHGMRSIALRYFNAAGAGYGIGEAHDPETHLIPLVLQTALGKHPALTIHGTDYPTPDGTCIRDYVHVLDLARAHALAAEVLAGEGGMHEAINLGTGRGTSVNEILGLAREIAGRPVEVVRGPRRPGDPAALYADAAKARRLLGWRAEHDIRDIVRDAWEWHLKAGN